MEEVLDTATEFEEQGNEPFWLGDFGLACSWYVAALKSMDESNRYLTGIQEMKFAGQTHVEIHLRFEYDSIGSPRSFACNSGKPLTRKDASEILEDIEYIQLITEKTVFGPAETAKLHLRRALTSEGMGRMARAVGEICDVISLDPINTRMKVELREWKPKVKEPKQIQAALEALTI